MSPCPQSHHCHLPADITGAGGTQCNCVAALTLMITRGTIYKSVCKYFFRCVCILKSGLVLSDWHIRFQV